MGAKLIDIPRIPRPQISISQFTNYGVGLGLEELRRLIQGRSRIPLQTNEQLYEESQRQIESKGVLTPAQARTYEELDPLSTQHQGYFKKDLGLVDLDTLERLNFQTVPQNLEYVPNANFHSINTVGRNNPEYHYTGGSDVLSFTLTWYSDRLQSGALDTEKTGVLTHCKWIEARSRNDGYNAEPPRVKLIWGSTRYTDATWLIQSSQYTTKLPDAQNDYLPTHAVQNITLIRVTEENSTKEQIQTLSY